MRVSANFRLDELLVSGTHPELVTPAFQLPVEILVNLCRVCFALQDLRDHFGPIVVTSGFRSELLNEKVGGSATSRHVQGCAADFRLTDYNAALAWEKLLDGEVTGSFDRLAFYPDGLRFHMDVSENGSNPRRLLYKAEPDWRLIAGTEEHDE